MINLLNAVITGAISTTIEDEAAVEAYIRTQNVSYFNLLYERFSRKVYAKCYSMLKDEMEAEDAMQEIFMKILVKISSFSGKSKFSTWLYSITYNFCLDKIRMAKRDKVVEVDDIGRLGDEMEDEIDDAELKEIALERLKVILEELNSEDKAVLLMKYQDDLSIKDMCEVLNKSESAMKMQIMRAKERFVKIHQAKYN
jgi:RNA polymerase sigma factor (sigma-70 family)